METTTAATRVIASTTRTSTARRATRIAAELQRHMSRVRPRPAIARYARRTYRRRMLQQGAGNADVCATVVQSAIRATGWSAIGACAEKTFNVVNAGASLTPSPSPSASTFYAARFTLRTTVVATVLSPISARNTTSKGTSILSNRGGGEYVTLNNDKNVYYSVSPNGMHCIASTRAYATHSPLVKYLRAI